MNQTIRGYTLTQWLGSGGMGEVYQAVHDSTQRTVAIKLLSQLEQAERFRNEAALQASVRHPHIALIYDFFVEKNLPCLVMEYVEGPTLQQVIRKNASLSEEAAWKYLGKIASALDYLHQRDIIHRDLKAGNIKLTREGQPKLLDFGLARQANSPRLTRQGHLVGTVASMAPEQFSGESNAASDCWALGVLFYEMLTGYSPFGGSTDSEIGRLIQKADYLSPVKLQPAISRASERLINKLLVVSPERRLTARQVLDIIKEPALLDKSDWMEPMRKLWGKMKL
ncbi:serine/threonine protein kinase [Spirosoma sp. BT702]|uniref:Serine/threonine protein kinase n=1 Tax=Spirosoma profusum TaxID=2771354 RepID=A0A926XXM1_9BACT|nr:serine/threonine-protein kinase [Spirosoma profusum]MBD2702784.1 serine/threonine protein kinase [Spirosoma profusum]